MAKGEADKEKRPSLLISQRGPSGFSRAEAFGNSLRGLRSVSAFLLGRISVGPRSFDAVAWPSAKRLLGDKGRDASWSPVLAQRARGREVSIPSPGSL